jgi:hypothetical protein
VNRRHLERVLPVYIRHDNEHRPHRSLDQRPLIEEPPPGSEPDVALDHVRHRDVLGGLIHEYKAAASEPQIKFPAPSRSFIAAGPLDNEHRRYELAIEAIERHAKRVHHESMSVSSISLSSETPLDVACSDNDAREDDRE